MKDVTKLYLIVALKNIATIICFTILAIVFDKWWIVLFSALFCSYISKESDNNER